MTINTGTTPVKPSQVSVASSLSGSERLLATRVSGPTAPKTIAVTTSMLAAIVSVDITQIVSAVQSAFTLPNTTVSVGVYGTSTIIPQITVNSAGQVTQVTRVTAPPVIADTFVRVSTDDGFVSANGLSQLIIVGSGAVDVSITGNTLTVSAPSETPRNIWATVSASSGSTTADVSADNLAVRGGGMIRTSITGDVLTIHADETPRNLLATISASSGSMTVDTSADTLDVRGGGAARTSITGDVLTIHVEPETARNLWATISASSGSTSADVSADNLAIRGDGSRISTSITGDVLTVFAVSVVSVGGATSIYGTSTIIPRITVDAFGNIVSVTNVTVDSTFGAQNLFANVSSSSGSMTATSALDTINVRGGRELSTSITGNVLTVYHEQNSVSSKAGKHSGSYNSGTQTITFPTFNITSTGHITSVSVTSFSLPGIATLEVANTAGAVTSTLDLVANGFSNISFVPDGVVSVELGTSGLGKAQVLLRHGQSTVVSGVYGNANAVARIQVDRYGHIVSVSEVSVSGGSGLASITVSAGNGAALGAAFDFRGNVGVSLSTTNSVVTWYLVSALDTPYILRQEGSIAIGVGAQTSGSGVAIGALSEALEAGTFALGVLARAHAAGGLALGTTSQITVEATNGVAVGNGAYVSARHGVAIGPASQVQATSAVAIGPQAITSVANQIKLGKAGAHVKSGGGIHFGSRSVSAGGVIQVTAGDGIIQVNSSTDAQTVLQLPTPDTVLGQVLTIYYNTSAATAAFPKVHCSVSATEAMLLGPGSFVSATFSELNQFIVLEAVASNRWAVLEQGGPTLNPIPTVSVGGATSVYGTSTIIPRITVNNAGQIVSIVPVTLPAFLTSETARNIWATVSASSGSTVADVSADNLAVRGDNSGQISTSITGDALTIFHNTLVSVGGTTSIYGTSLIIPRLTINQYGHIVSVIPVTLPAFLTSETPRLIWSTVSASSGSTTADVSADNLAIRGDATGTISTSITGDVLTVFHTSQVSVGGATSVYGTSLIIPRLTISSTGHIVSVVPVTLPAFLLTETPRLIWSTVSASSGSTTADVSADNLAVRGDGSRISTSITGDVLTVFALSVVSVGGATSIYGTSTIIPRITVDPFGNIVSIVPVTLPAFLTSETPRSIWATISASSGATTADVSADNLAVRGDGLKISTSITGDVLTIFQIASVLSVGGVTSIYGTSTIIPRITVDAYGQIVSITNVTAPAGAGGLSFATVSASSGSTTADSGSDNLAVRGDDSGQISTSITGDILTVYHNTLVSVGGATSIYGTSTIVPRITVNQYGHIVSITLVTAPPAGGAQNLWATISASSGSTAASDTADNLAVRGDDPGQISTSITGDVLTVYHNALVSVGGATSSYGTENGSGIPRITVNQYGHIVSVKEVQLGNITINASAGITLQVGLGSSFKVEGRGIVDTSVGTSGGVNQIVVSVAPVIVSASGGSLTGSNISIHGKGGAGVHVSAGSVVVSVAQSSKVLLATLSCSATSKFQFVDVFTSTYNAYEIMIHNLACNAASTNWGFRLGAGTSAIVASATYYTRMTVNMTAGAVANTQTYGVISSLLGTSVSGAYNGTWQLFNPMQAGYYKTIHVVGTMVCTGGAGLTMHMGTGTLNANAGVHSSFFILCSATASAKFANQGLIKVYGLL